MTNPVRKMEAYLAKDPSLKESAQRAFVSYVKAVFLMKDKSVFKVNSLDTDSFAHSLGLAIPPRIRFLQRMNAKVQAKQNTLIKTNNNNNKKKYFEIESDSEDEKLETNYSDGNIENGVKEVCNKSFQVSDGEDSDKDILTVKRKDHEIDLPGAEEIFDLNEGRKKNKKAVTKAALAKKILKKNIVPNKKIVFTEDGEAVTTGIKEKKSELAIQYELEDSAGIDIEKARIVLKEEDKFDKQYFKEKVKAKHKETKRKLKEKKKSEQPKDDFGESESEEEPDLSWLPDPDKIYGEKIADVEQCEDDLKPEIHSKAKPQKVKRYVQYLVPYTWTS